MTSSFPFGATGLADETSAFVSMAEMHDPADKTGAASLSPEAEMVAFRDVLPPRQPLPPAVRAR